MATMKETRSLTWWIFWRYLVAIFAFDIGMRIVVAVFVALSGGSTQNYDGIVRYGILFPGLIVFFLISNFLVTKVVGKTIKGKRLMLVDTE